MKCLLCPIITQSDAQWGMRNAFKRQFEVRELDWYRAKTLHGCIEIFNDAFLQLVQSQKFDLVFTQFHGPVLPTEVLRKAKEAAPNTKFVTWCGDVRNETPQWSIDQGKLWDYTLYTNMRDVNNLQIQGINARYLQIGFDDEKYRPYPLLNKTDEILFLGSNYHGNKSLGFPKSLERKEMVRYLGTKYAARFRCHGFGWNSKINSLTPEQEVEAYNKCGIAINQNHYSDIPRFTSDRLFRAMGSGAYVISNYYPDIELEFQPGVHLDIFTSLDRLYAQVEWALSHPKERAKIAIDGCNHVHLHHTWDCRIKQLKELLCI